VSLPRASSRLRLVAGGIVILVWVAGWFVRRHYGTPNVDDYLYTLVAHRLWTPLATGDVLGAVGAFLSTGKNAPLVLAFGAPLSNWGPDAVVFLQLPLLLCLFALVFAIVERASGATLAIVAALITTLSPPVLNWSLMVHMAIASSVCTLGVVNAYLRSEGFTRRWPSVRVGIWLGLLALSRSMAPLYVAMVCAAILLSLLRFHRGRIMTASRNIVLGVCAALAVAGPWYWKSGLTALTYIRTVGYSADAGYAWNGDPVRLRIGSTLHGMGDALVALLLLILALGLLARSRKQWRGAGNETRFVLFVFAGLVLGFLCTTNVAGTAFDLPVIVTVIPAVVLCLPVKGPALKILAPVGLLVSALAIAQAWLLPGWEGRSGSAPAPAYASAFLQALGDPASRAAAKPVNDDVGRVVGDHDIFVTRDDAVINIEGLSYFKLKNGWGGRVDTPSYDLRVKPVSVPSGYEFVLTGQSCVLYHQNVDRAVVESFLRAGTWSIVSSSHLSPCNDVVLWRRRSLTLAELVEVLRTDSHPEVRVEAAQAIWRKGAAAASAVDALMAALADGSPEVRLNAAGALAAIGPSAKSALPALGGVLISDPDALVREQAVKTISALAPAVKESVASLTLALTDKEGFVRVAAAYALAEMGPAAAAAIPALTRMLKDEDDGAREAAQYAIVEVRGRDD
jgi:hypothetical protein